MAYTTIDKSDEYFNTVLYTGNGATQSITGVGFQPDWVWIKTRSSTYPNVVTDAVRGATNNLYTNLTDAEDSSANYLTSFDSDGFSVGSYAGVNLNSATMVGWSWKANGAGVSNTAGSITSTVSANTTSGFSIVSYTGNAVTGATIGHGLGVTPDVIIAKSRVSVDSWGFFHSAFSSQQYMFLNSTAAVATASSVWYALPNSSVFTVGDNASVNDNGNMIAYCFAEKKGFSKFGSYTGNGSTDGPFIYTGFKPAFLIAKRTSSTGNWRTRDNKRSTFNAVELVLNPNLNAAETTEDAHDFLSNGFKVRTSGPENNSSGGSFIYMAFAENPFVTSTSIPTTAR